MGGKEKDNVIKHSKVWEICMFTCGRVDGKKLTWVG